MTSEQSHAILTLSNNIATLTEAVDHLSRQHVEVKSVVDTTRIEVTKIGERVETHSEEITGLRKLSFRLAVGLSTVGAGAFGLDKLLG